MMTRSELKEKVGNVFTSALAAIEGAPLRGFVFAFVLGALTVLLWSYIYALLVVVVIGLGGLYLFADESPSAAAERPLDKGPDLKTDVGTPSSENVI